MEIICLDNGLITKGEHSYNLAANLAKALSRRNLRHRVFGLRALDPSIIREIGAIPHFARSLYDNAGASRKEKRLWPTAAIIRGALVGGPVNLEQKARVVLNETFEKDLDALPPGVWNFENLVVVPSVSQNQILGLIRFLLRRPQEQLPRVVCQLMFPPSWTPWGEVSRYGQQFYQDAFGLAGPLLDHSLFFTVENEAMQSLFANKFGIRANILPIPFAGSPHKETGDGVVRLGFFGYSKCDKGFHLLPKAIALCQRQQLGAEFIVQIQHSGWEHRTVEAERALRALKGVRFLEGVLTGAEYAAWSNRLDAMLLPYDPVAFGNARGSGIFTESLAAGRPIIASKGTFAGTSIEKNEAEGEVFTPHTSEALAAAVARLIPRLRRAGHARRSAPRHSRSITTPMLTSMFCCHT